MKMEAFPRAENISSDERLKPIVQHYVLLLHTSLVSLPGSERVPERAVIEMAGQIRQQEAALQKKGELEASQEVHRLLKKMQLKDIPSLEIKNPPGLDEDTTGAIHPDSDQMLRTTYGRNLPAV